MKKNKQSNSKNLFYGILLVIGLLLIWQYFNSPKTPDAPFVEEITTVSTGANDSVIVENEVIGIDADGNAAIGDAVEIEEENPDETGGEGETIVKE